MTSMQHWAPDQWAVFTVTIAAGLIAVTILGALQRTRRYVAPALRRAIAPPPRPSIVMAERRQPIPRAEPWPFDDRWLDPMAADFGDPGIGALSSIQRVTVDPTLRTSAELHAEEDAWVNAYADLSPLMPETDAAVEQMRVNLEPAWRKVHLWRLRGEGGEQRQRLNDWRMNTSTGEWPLHGARALLVA